MFNKLWDQIRRKLADIADVIDKYHVQSSWVNITAPLTGLLTLSIYLSVGIVSADYKGEGAIYYATLLIEVILFLILLWEFCCCVGSRAIRKWAVSLCTISGVIIVLAAIVCFGVRNWSSTKYYMSVTEVYGIPTGIESTRLSKRDLDGQAGYWEIKDIKFKNHMTLTYVDAYKQSEIMQQYSTLYNMSLFQNPVRIEIDYKRSGNKDKYRSYGQESFEAASRNDFREPVKVSYYNDSGKLVLELKKNDDDVFKVMTYSTKDMPQLLNSTLLCIPEGQSAENDMIFQQIEVTYNSAGLPETRKLKPCVNLYGVSGERYVYNADNRLSTLYFLDDNGMPVCNSRGIMTIDFKYNEEGNLQSICYYSDEEKAEKTEGFYDVFQEKFLYDRGNLVERIQLGRGGSPCYDRKGVCKYSYVYENGKLKEEAFYGRNNASVYIKIGELQCCSVKYDKWTKNNKDKISVLFGLRTFQDMPTESFDLQTLRELENSGTSGTEKGGQNENKAKTDEPESDDETGGKTENSRTEISKTENSMAKSSSFDQVTVPDDVNDQPEGVKLQEDAALYLDMLSEENRKENIRSEYTSIVYTIEDGLIEEMRYFSKKEANEKKDKEEEYNSAVKEEEYNSAVNEEEDNSAVKEQEDNSAVNEQGCSIRRFTYDSNLRIIKEEFLNADGSDCIIDEGYSAIETVYADGESEQIQCLRYLDADSNPVKNSRTGYAIIQYEYGGRSMWEDNSNLADSTFWREEAIQDRYTEGERCISEYYLDEYEKPILSHEMGYASVKKLYNENGLLIGEAYYGKLGEPTYRTDYGVAKILYEYSEIGNRICDQYLDKDGEPVNRLDTGYSFVYWEYEMGKEVKEYYEARQGDMLYAAPDKQTGAAIIVFDYSNGQKVGESYFDVNRKPVLHNEFGCAKRKYEYENGKVCRQSFYGVTDKLILRKDLGAAVIQYEYDDAGRETAIRYYGVDEQPVISMKYKCAGFHYSYDEISGNKSDIWYVGLDGKTMIRQDLGYAHVHYEYDKDGNKTGESYLDAEENPVAQKEGGYAFYEYEFDKERGYAKGKYLNRDEDPVLRKDYGYAWFEDFFENGKCIESRYHDTKDNLILRKDKGYAVVKYEYNEFGQCTLEKYYGTDYNGDGIEDADEEPLVISTEYKCAGFRYEYDDYGRQKSIEYLGEDGESFLRGDRGFAFVKYDYDERGFRRASRYYDKTGENLVISTEYNCAGFDYEYDERGNQKEVYYIGLDNKLMVRRDYGNAYDKKQYDDVGNLVEESYYNKEDEPVIWRERGYASLEYTFENGNKIETRLYDIDHALTLWKDKGYAIEKTKYDEAGQCVSRLYYDANEQPVFHEEYHCAGFRYSYDERGNQTGIWYIGTDGKVMLRQDLGYAHVEYEYDDRGRKVRESYYDVSGERTACKEGGYAFCEYYYDVNDNENENDIENENDNENENDIEDDNENENDNENCDERRYYDANGNLVLRKDNGYAIERFKYDELGRCVLEEYYDIWGEESVISTKYHCAGFCYKYDDKGNQTDLWYLGVDGRPTDRSDCGVAQVHKRYDCFGNLEGEDYFAVDKDNSEEDNIQYKPAAWKEKGYSSFSNRYENGRCIESQYKLNDELTLRQDTGYAVVERKYDEWGQCTGIYYKGTNGKRVFGDQSCAGYEYDYNEKGERTDIWYIGLDGKPMLREDVGYAHIQYEYDEMGQEIQVSYLDTNGDFAVVKEGEYRYVVKTYLNGKCIAGRYYDDYINHNLKRRTDTRYAYYIDVYENGNWVEGRYYDENDNLIQRRDVGYAVTKRKYNASGQCIAIDYYDATGVHPIISNKYSCAGYRYAYDKKGNQTDLWYIGLDGKPLTDASWGYAHVHTDYDETGMEIRKSYFDSNEEPAVYISGGYASMEKQYKNGNCIEERYYGTDGNLVLRKDTGYAVVKYQYNNLGQKKAEYYYGTDNQRIESKEQCAGYQYSYDERGNQTYIWCEDVNGEVKWRGDKGGETQYKSFDELDNLIAEAYYVYDDAGYHYKDFKNLGYTSVNYTYEGTKLIEKKYKDEEENIIIRPGTEYVVQKWEYNENGLLEWEKYCDENGDLIYGVYSYAKKEYIYDASGNFVKNNYYDHNGDLME